MMYELVENMKYNLIESVDVAIDGWCVMMSNHDSRDGKYYRHTIEVAYKGDFIGHIQYWNNRKKLDPYDWFESYELGYNSPYKQKFSTILWDTLIRLADKTLKLQRIEYKKNKTLTTNPPRE